jgi:hypothetical protein
MTTYIHAIARCICCGVIFSFNPDRVPSTKAINGEREPVCERCMTTLNVRRKAQGLEPFAILDGAYEAKEVE